MVQYLHFRILKFSLNTKMLIASFSIFLVAIYAHICNIYIYIICIILCSSFANLGSGATRRPWRGDLWAAEPEKICFEFRGIPQHLPWTSHRNRMEIPLSPWDDGHFGSFWCSVGVFVVLKWFGIMAETASCKWILWMSRLVVVLSRCQ